MDIPLGNVNVAKLLRQREMSNCPRDLDECEPKGLYDTPETFICSGIHDGTTNIHEQDIYRLCVKTDDIDLLMDLDDLDANHLVAVLMGVVDANRYN